MATKIFVNLPVKDLQKSIEFFTKLGYSFNQQFTDDKAACLIIEDNSIYAMLLVDEYFKTFTQKELADAHKVTEVLISIEVGSKEKVDELVRKAEEAGGIIYREAQDYGWMYQHCFADLDGHQWEVFYTDPNGFPQE